METLSVVFTDLVGSTDQRVRVGEEEADHLRVRHDRLARVAVLTHGGLVVKHTGDGVMATFGGASEALAAAVAVQQAIAADNVRQRERDRGAETLRVRIGISAGDVSIEGDDCFGLPVVEAQRLESAAQPGQILASSLVRALARGRGAVDLRSIGALDLKGLNGPLDVDEVVWSPLDVSAGRSLPPVLVDRGGFPFAGRVKEAGLLDGAWSASSTGGTRFVLVAGEPGIGKTRLVAELAGRVADGDGIVLAGRCDELVGVPYQPFVEALRWQVGRPGGTDVLGPTPGELARLVPELGEMVPGLPRPLEASNDAERMRLFEAVRGWVAALAEERPVLVALDDLHWADTGTLLLVRHVVVNDPVPRLLVTGTYRDTDLDRSHPLASMLAEFRRRSEVTRISLDGLDAGEVTDLLTRAADHELEQDGLGLALALQEETGGNPFFVGEVMRHLAESGAIVRRDGRWIADRADPAMLPEGIRDVVGRRLSVLPDETQNALRTAAVIGTRFTLDVLSLVSGRDEDTLLDALDTALTAHLLTESGIGTYQFAHALVRSTLHAELSTTRRARLHRAVAAALEELHSDRDEVAADLAYHWSEAGAASAHEEAIAYSRRAAELAYERTSPEESVRWYRQARELLDGADPRLDAELLFHIGEAEVMATMPGWQETLLEAARAAEAVGDLELMVDALSIHQRSVFIESSPERADPTKIDLMEQALVLAGDNERLRARLSAVLAVEMIFAGDLARRDALVADVRAIGQAITDPIERYRLYMLLGGATSPDSHTRTDMEDIVDEAASTLEVARTAGAHDVEWIARRNLFYGNLALGRRDWRDAATESVQAIDTYPHPYVHDQVLLVQMMEALIDGDNVLANQRADQLERQWQRHNRAEGWIYAASGRLQAARETIGLGALLDLIRALPGYQARRPDVNSALLALALCDTGDLDAARALLEERSTQNFRDIPDDAALPIARSIWSDVAAHVADQHACATLYDIMLGRHNVHQVTGGWYLGATSHYLGTLAAALGRDDDSDRWFSQAEREHLAVDSPPWIARTRLNWAGVLLHRKDRTHARALAERAQNIIGDLPLDVSRTHAERILADTS